MCRCLFSQYLMKRKSLINDSFIIALAPGAGGSGRQPSGMGKLVPRVVQPISNLFTWLWDGIKTGFTGVANFIAGMFENVINGLIDAVNWFLEGFSNVVEWAGDIIGQDWGGIKPLERVKLPRFENGGFPDQGSLFVAGETYGKTEWVGNINGRTGVASGNEITGIADAIYSTSQEEMELLRQQNQYLYEIMNKEFGITRTQIGREAQSYAREYFNQTGRQAFQV